MDKIDSDVKFDIEINMDNARKEKLNNNWAIYEPIMNVKQNLNR